MKTIEAKSYTILTESGGWLGQVTLTNDGMFASVTDYGNLSYAWRSYGKDFREFLISLNTDYFASKMYQGMTYMVYGKKHQKMCDNFAIKILPALQKLLKEELEFENSSDKAINDDSITEQQIREIGFKLTDSFDHDQYHTNRYKLSQLEVEFTYEEAHLLTSELTISDLNCMPITYNKIKQITDLLGHWDD